MFASVEMRVKVGPLRSSTFQSTQGVKQGDPLSPLLFGLFIEVLHEMLVDLNRDCGVKVLEKCIISLLYADDATLVASTPQELQRMLQTVECFCDTCGMKVNIKNK